MQRQPLLPAEPGKPRPGFYRVRLVKGGPWCPARIFAEPAIDPVTAEPLERPVHLLAEIGGEAADLFRVWPICWEIPEAEYRYMMDMIAWATENAQDHPVANPRRAIDLGDLDPVW